MIEDLRGYNQGINAHPNVSGVGVAVPANGGCHIPSYIKDAHIQGYPAPSEEITCDLTIDTSGLRKDLQQIWDAAHSVKGQKPTFQGTYTVSTYTEHTDGFSEAVYRVAATSVLEAAQKFAAAGVLAAGEVVTAVEADNDEVLV